MNPLKTIISAALLLTPACTGVQSGDINTAKGAVVSVAVNDAPPKKVETEEEKARDLRLRADVIEDRILKIALSDREKLEKVDACFRELPSCETYRKELYGALDRNPKAVAKCDALGMDTKEWSDCLIEVGKNDPIQLEASVKCNRDVLECIGKV